MPYADFDTKKNCPSSKALFYPIVLTFKRGLAMTLMDPRPKHKHTLCFSLAPYHVRRQSTLVSVRFKGKLFFFPDKWQLLLLEGLPAQCGARNTSARYGLRNAVIGWARPNRAWGASGVGQIGDLSIG